jgi:hypothetical protein
MQGLLENKVVRNIFGGKTENVTVDEYSEVIYDFSG